MATLAKRPSPRATNCPEVGVDRGGPLRVFAMRRPKPEGYRLVNTTSHAATPEERGLSPFSVGPVVTYDGSLASNIENLGQFSKVYAKYADAAGWPSAEYFQWARSGWSDPVARRYPMGRGARPLYAYWAGERLGYVEARARIYAPLYAEAVAATPSFAWLQGLYRSGVPIGLVDFDGWDHVGQGYTLAEVLRADRIKMGHAFVLAGLLTGDRFWEAAFPPAPPAEAPALLPPLTDAEVEEILGE